MKDYDLKFDGDHYMSSPRLVDAAIRNILTINKFCIKPKIILDIGANVGVYSCVFAKLFDAKIYSFEPVKTNYTLLEKNISLNNFQEKIIPYNLALWSKSCMLNLGIPEDRNEENTGLFSAFYKNKSVETKAVKLDEFLEISPDLIKIDAEGAEYEILQGGKNIISKSQCIYIERGKRVNLLFPPYYKIEEILKEIKFERRTEGADEIWTKQTLQDQTQEYLNIS